MKRKCPICKEEYEDGGNHWKKVCYNCYKDYRLLVLFGKPIKSMAYKEDIYISHPSATKEDVENFIKRCGYENGWGAEEIKPEDWSKYKLWRVDTNYD